MELLRQGWNEYKWDERDRRRMEWFGQLCNGYKMVVMSKTGMEWLEDGRNEYDRDGMGRRRTE